VVHLYGSCGSESRSGIPFIGIVGRCTAAVRKRPKVHSGDAEAPSRVYVTH